MRAFFSASSKEELGNFIFHMSQKETDFLCTLQQLNYCTYHKLQEIINYFFVINKILHDLKRERENEYK